MLCYSAPVLAANSQRGCRRAYLCYTEEDLTPPIPSQVDRQPKRDSPALRIPQRLHL
jgi:hypothetical protein